jgi:hypothetical protein
MGRKGRCGGSSGGRQAFQLVMEATRLVAAREAAVDCKTGLEAWSRVSVQSQRRVRLLAVDIGKVRVDGIDRQAANNI